MTTAPIIAFNAETRSGLYGHSTEWTIHHKNEIYFVKIFNAGRNDQDASIYKMSTNREVKTTSKLGKMLSELAITAHDERFPQDTPHDTPDTQLEEVVIIDEQIREMERELDTLKNQRTAHVQELIDAGTVSAYRIAKATNRLPSTVQRWVA